MPDRVKGVEEVGGSKDCLSAQPGFVKPIRNGPRKIKSWIQSRPTRAETIFMSRGSLALDSRKKSERDKLMLSNSFETQESREAEREQVSREISCR